MKKLIKRKKFEKFISEIYELYERISSLNPDNIEMLTHKNVEDKFPSTSDYVIEIMKKYDFPIVYCPNGVSQATLDLLESKNEREFLKNLERYLVHLRRWAKNEELYAEEGCILLYPD